LMPKGEYAHNYPCGGGVCLHAYLSIYPRIVDMYEPICVVCWLVKKPRTF
jgi:hypothetical protein